MFCSAGSNNPYITRVSDDQSENINRLRAVVIVFGWLFIIILGAPSCCGDFKEY